jgi:hypothetical protein
MAESMNYLQENTCRRNALAESGQKRAERYRDSVIVQRLMDAYERGKHA